MKTAIARGSWTGVQAGEWEVWGARGRQVSGKCGERAVVEVGRWEVGS